jgi:ATP-dependent DNA helicase RecQ
VSTEDIFKATLKRYFGYEDFRGIQQDIVRSVYEGHDTLGLMPTGGGKSITFQVPAMMMEGTCLVVTPLISLMEDQVNHLRERGIAAATIYSGMSKDEVQKVLDNTVFGAVKFLYVSPERLSTTLFLAKLRFMKICMLTIDEAHCISQWGYDFRPAYMNIASIRDELQGVPVLALTATATTAVANDIMERLGFGKYNDKEPQLFRMSFQRPNLSYVVRRTENKIRELEHILNSVSGSAIVYTRSREKTREIAEILENDGISADFYHAGLDFAIKNKRQALWQQDEKRVMVATNAFGMGIDKPDVRLVVHYDVPDSLEAYFQEAGRAGRDGKRAYAVMLTQTKDSRTLRKHLDEAFPPKDYIREVYDHLAYFFELATESGEGAMYIFDHALFCTRFHHSFQMLDGALGVLQNAGYIRYDNDPDSRVRLMVSMSKMELYGLDSLLPDEEKVLNTVLRMYGTLFTHLTYVNIQMIAHRCGMDEKTLRRTLTGLAIRRVIKYVPERDLPIITYTRQRVLSERLVFPREAYEMLKDRMSERIESIIRYIESNTACRQQMLMAYFGEKAPRCGHCDVCLDGRQAAETYDSEDSASNNTSSASNNVGSASSEYKKNYEMLLNLLSDGKKHLIADVQKINIPTETIKKIINSLRDENMIATDGVYLQLCTR